ncbi:hypothetical protein SAMN04244553_6703 [Nocardia amikacinitolerans]|uniref:Uncharacterized protein n=1 Tax=Nocardia amikacinitolerans TaxID=756689 RepID=A0A285LXM2_9NOCA|nr:hypothetical protein [Nocardia amikacinitolerans]MCP2279802.1 hypothetical protein [Nocardia amikacinitolerans]MCP2298785.1 hypothetical protein [Nocardia amikacinitolerans]MCP2319140.1 hypothetical protein [Nocardia amikacinitolerans]SNY89684.1 hypothetical protein SAMN04244553_6703 [Nocardia amikacinitolerans]
MTTPTPRPQGPGVPGPGPNAPRPGIPLPGRHLPGAQGRPEPADPDRIRSEIDSLLAELDARGAAFGAAAESAESGVDITRRARILEQAHDVLVQALATVDKI